MTSKMKTTVPNNNPSFDVNALGQAMDSTFGRTSTPKEVGYSDPEEREAVEWRIDSASKSSSFSTRSVKASLSTGHDGETYYVTMKYAAIVNFGENDKQQMTAKWEDEANQIINQAVKKIKDVYSEFADDSLTLTKKSKNDKGTVEVIHSTIYNPKLTAYFRKSVVYEVK